MHGDNVVQTGVAEILCCGGHLLGVLVDGVDMATVPACRCCQVQRREAVTGPDLADRDATADRDQLRQHQSFVSGDLPVVVDLVAEPVDAVDHSLNSFGEHRATS